MSDLPIFAIPPGPRCVNCNTQIGHSSPRCDTCNKFTSVDDWARWAFYCNALINNYRLETDYNGLLEIQIQEGPTNLDVRASIGNLGRDYGNKRVPSRDDG